MRYIAGIALTFILLCGVSLRPSLSSADDVPERLAKTRKMLGVYSNLQVNPEDRSIHGKEVHLYNYGYFVVVLQEADGKPGEPVMAATSRFDPDEGVFEFKLLKPEERRFIGRISDDELVLTIVKTDQSETHRLRKGRSFWAMPPDPRGKQWHWIDEDDRRLRAGIVGNFSSTSVHEITGDYLGEELRILYFGTGYYAITQSNGGGLGATADFVGPLRVDAEKRTVGGYINYPNAHISNRGFEYGKHGFYLPRGRSFWE